jgi:peptidoglycan/LPS O-acetylase OafA/YrhL
MKDVSDAAVKRAGGRAWEFISDSVLKAEANNFTVVRLVLATLVIYTHCFVLLHGGPDRGEDRDETSAFLGAPISTYAVDGFFFLSGFLVYPSLARIGKVGYFLGARLARLWPALFVCIAITVIVGFFITSTPGAAYFKGATLRFIFGNLSFVKAYYWITGVNCGNFLCNVNQSLWTLPAEARCYLMLAALGLCGLTRPARMLWVVLPATAVFAAIWDFEVVRQAVTHRIGAGPAFVVGIFHRLWPLFALGCAAYVVRRRLPLSWWALAALFGLTVVSAALRLGAAMQARALFVGYAVLCFGLLTAGRRSLSGRWPDYSYGMYIFAAPAMMVADGLLHARSHWVLALETVAFTLPAAALSWHCIEKPALEGFRRWRAGRVSPGRSAPA